MRKRSCVVLLLLCLVLSGCGSGTSGNAQVASPSAAAAETSASSSTPTSSGALSVKMTFGGQAQKAASAQVAVGLPASAAAVEIRVLDPTTGADLVPPRIVAHDPDATEQTVVITGIRAGEVKILVTALDSANNVLGFGVQGVHIAANADNTVTIADTVTVVSITVTPSTAVIIVGTTQQFTVEATFSDNSIVSLASAATWTSSLPSAASVDANGKTSGLARGVTTITATFGGSSSSATLTVRAATDPVSVSVNPATASVGMGSTTALTVIATFADGSTQDVTADATWQSSAPEIATVAAGVVTGVSAGSGQITASWNGASGSASLTVVAPSSLTVTPASATTTVGATTTLNAVASYPDGASSDVTAIATWASSSPTTATVAGGIVTGVLNGTTTVTASYGGTSAPATIVVTQPQRKWNFLVYLDADNDLESFSIANFNQMEAVGSTDDVNVLVLYDRIAGYDESNGAWTGTRLYKVTRDGDTGTITSQVLTESPWGKTDDSIEADMANPQTLTDFLVWCQQNYPADHTCLTLWDHGGAVWPRKPASKQRRGRLLTLDSAQRGICWDDTSAALYPASWNALMTDHVESGLSNARAVTGRKVDIVNLDACLMQTLELAYQLKDEANFMVGSEANVPGPGNNYQLLLERLAGTPTITGSDYAIGIVQDYAAFYGATPELTYSALDLSYMPTLMTTFSQFATQVNAVVTNSGSNPQAMTDLYDAYLTADFMDWDEYIDLHDFARLLEAGGVPGVDSAPALQTAVDTLVISNYTTAGHETSRGLTILGAYYGESWSAYSGANQYVLLDLAQDTNWNEFLAQVSAWADANP